MLPRAIISALLFLATTCTSLGQDYRPAPPTLTLIDSLMTLSRWYAHVPDQYHDFRGLVIEETSVVEYHQVVPMIFFDYGSAVIPTRCVLFDSYEQTLGFDESKLPGGTIEKYHQVLNVIGSRLRADTGASVEIVGTNSEGATSLDSAGETLVTSRGRGEAVYDYLTRVWRIPARQLKLLQPRGLPSWRYNPKDPLGTVMNRQGSIGSRDWSVSRPVRDSTVRTMFFPEMGTLLLSKVDTLAGTPRSRVVVVQRNGKEWNRFVLPPEIHTLFHFTWKSIDGTLPVDGDTLVVQSIVQRTDGREERSNEVKIPVMHVWRDRARTEFRTDRTVTTGRVHAVEFHKNSYVDRVLSEYMLPAIQPVSVVTVTSGTSIIGLSDRNLHLSRHYAGHVRAVIKRRGRPASVQLMPIGETMPQFDNATPEGRVFNSTTSFIVSTIRSANDQP